jgi:hypothetical protein
VVLAFAHAVCLGEQHGLDPRGTLAIQCILQMEYDTVLHMELR